MLNNPELFVVDMLKNQVTVTPKTENKKIRFNFTEEEVADHNNIFDAWIIINEEV